MTIQEKIQTYQNEQKYVQIFRGKDKSNPRTSRGYIVAYSEKFIVFHEVLDFKWVGFNVYPIAQIKKIKSTKYDVYYDYIFTSEENKKDLEMKRELDLTNWKTVFDGLFSDGKSIIVECEEHHKNGFIIGKITGVKEKKVYVHNFNALGFLDKKPKTIKFKHITKVIFDDSYVDTFSKYVRKRLPRVQEHKSDLS